MFETLVSYFCKNVGEELLEYMSGRKIYEEDVKKFNIGYVNNNGLPNIKNKEWMEWKEKAKLRNAIVFPLYNMVGKPVALEFRTIKKKFHFKFIPDQTKDIETFFFGLPQALEAIWETKTIYIAEGPSDALTMHKALPNVVASSTAGLTTKQLSFIKRYVDKVIFVYDNDKTGKLKQEKLSDLLWEKYSISSTGFTYPRKDANAFVVEFGEEAFIKKTKQLVDDIKIL